MPLFEYEAADAAQACPRCRQPFEVLRRLSDPPLTNCPDCGAPVRKLISAPSVGASRSGFDDRAKQAGFHKLQRVGKGEYEKKY